MNAGKTNPDRFILFALTVVIGLLAPSWAVGADRVPDELLAAVNANRHRIEAAGGGHHADNPGNRLQFQFGGEAVNIAPSSPGQSWQLALKLTGYGTPDKIKPVATASVAAKGANRLEYRRGALTEWYENRPEGLEQGFTLTQPPQPGAKTVVLDLAVSGGLQPQLAKDAQSVALLDAAGKAALTYGDLKVIDARGANLPAKLALADGKVRIAVQTEQAIWPIVVDPLVKSAVSVTGDPTGADRFGYAIAASGTTAVIGAPQDGTGALLLNSGAAYIYERTGSGWAIEKPDLFPSTQVLNERFGYAVSVNGDTVAIGAPFNNSNVGRVCVFVRTFPSNVPTWTQQQCFTGITPDASTSDDFFGTSVAVYGNTLVVGAPGREIIGTVTATNGGAVYVFTRSGSTWTQQVMVPQTTPVSNHYFGSAVALSVGATGRFVAGAPGVTRPSQTGSAATTPGTAEVFSGADASWSSEGLLSATGLGNGDRFGWTVALYQLNDNPTTAMVGAPFHDFDATHVDSGAAYAFVRSSLGAWSEQAILEDDGHVALDEFGYSVALGEGTAVIGVPLADDTGVTNSGEAYVWTHGSGSVWTEAQQMFISNAPERSAVAGANFGWAVAIAGNSPLVGAPNDNNGGTATNHGEANIYTYPCAFGRSYTAAPTPQWMMLAMPCTPTSDSVGGVLSTGNPDNAHFFNNRLYNGTSWSSDLWTITVRPSSQISNTNTRLTNLDTPGTMIPGDAYWLYSGLSPTGPLGPPTQVDGAIASISAGTATVVVSQATNPRCASSNGCYVLPLVKGSGRYNMVGNPLPFNVDWADVRLQVENPANTFTAYTPTAANDGSPNNFMAATMWYWNGSTYVTCSDAAGTTCVIRSMTSFFVKMGTNSDGVVGLKLLIPNKTSLKTSSVSPAQIDPLGRSQQPWPMALLDWLIPAAAADERSEPEDEAVGLHERDAHVRRVEKAIKEKKAWRVRLSAEIPAMNLIDPGNWLGQLPDSLIGFDSEDLVELEASSTPYLTIVFPHLDWGTHAGIYTTDYHSLNESKADRTWTFEIRTDQAQIGQTVYLGWEGDPAVLRRCTVTDPASGQVFRLDDPQYRFGMPVFMASPVQKLVWRYKGVSQDDARFDDPQDDNESRHR